MKLVVGLGNPGDKYQKTRHNLGFTVLDDLAKKVNSGEIKWTKEEKFKSETLSLITQHFSLILVKPLTYMNNSGLAVKLLTSYYKLPATNLIVVYDDLDLPLGKIKIRLGGSAAGHHGVESIIKTLNSDQFIRVRLGIGPTQGVDVAKLAEHKKSSFNVDQFVLEAFLPQERSKVKHLIKQSIHALETLLEKGLEKAQNQYN